MNEGLLPKVNLLTNDKSEISFSHYADHEGKLIYNEALAKMLLSAKFLQQVDPKTDEVVATKLTHLQRPTCKQSGKVIIFPCGFTHNDIYEKMNHYLQLPNEAASTLIKLYFDQKFSRLVPLNNQLATIEDPIESTIQELSPLHTLKRKCEGTKNYDEMIASGIPPLFGVASIPLGIGIMVYGFMQRKRHLDYQRLMNYRTTANNNGALLFPTNNQEIADRIASGSNKRLTKKHHKYTVDPNNKIHPEVVLGHIQKRMAEITEYVNALNHYAASQTSTNATPSVSGSTHQFHYHTIATTTTRSEDAPTPPSLTK